MINRQGLWLPPRARFGSEVRDGQTTGTTYLFNGREVEVRPDLLESAIHYKTVSMYFSRGYFYIVPYDATENQVGSGRQVEGEPASDSDDAEHDPDEEPDPTTIDWSLLHFHWELNGYTSKIWASASETRLNTQRPDQYWVNEILTDAHHALPERRTSEPSCGGLAGDLAILIGLVAFSATDARVDAVLRHCIKPLHNGGWITHGRERGEGWVDQRGFRIKVYSCHPYSTAEHLQFLEEGGYGWIYQ